MVQKLFFVAALEHPEPFKFWQSSISIDPQCDIDDLQEALITKYASIHHIFAATIYKPYQSHRLDNDVANTEFPDKQTLLQKATSVPMEDLIQQVFPVRQTFIVIFQNLTPPVSVVPAENSEEIDDETNDVVTQLRQDFTRYVDGVMKGKTPSSAAKSANYDEIQASAAALLDGRSAKNGPQTAAPPIELYHPVFGRFSELSNCPDLEVPENVLRDTAELLRSVSTISIREAPRDEGTRLLTKILGISLEHVVNQDRTSADYLSVQHTPFNINAAPFIGEVKGEMGNGGSDPSVQVSFSYSRFYCNSERAQIRAVSCCPAFLVGIAGPWLVILGAVLTSRTIVQRLSPFEWLACSRVLDSEQVHRIARRLYALRLSIEQLGEYYRTLSSPPVASHLIHPRFCPSINHFSLDGKQIPFVYVHPLERDPVSVTFKVIRLDTKQAIVIKFVRQYGHAAHVWMSEQGLAPKLLSYTSLGDHYGNLHLVAMEFVEGQTLDDAYSISEPLPADIQNGVRRALDILAEKKFIFGDLRRPNVILANGTDSIEKRIRFVDFDWVGKEGEFRYPFHLASVVRNPSGALEYDLITREHQENMFEQL
ncbi:hypothetical protein GYMLUDRAFT_83497 [Collybiopsis luxurians FD-317 M1]|uniref:Protein kinase domain-containing protein n=1 Tax=Collybiopsis luxurians FD-317 M1 TaxID=944289 RepID=A0A0D0D489_9AGAR|nr:hypothetical protein GYMLUDRAFT_83497 [Collybiopsis luxurians FD-317 M1]